MRQVGFPPLDQPPLAHAFTHISCINESVLSGERIEQVLSQHAIQYTTQGEAIALVGGRAYHHRPGRLFAVAAGQHLVEEVHRPWQLAYVMLEGPWCAPLAEALATTEGALMLDRPPRPWIAALIGAIDEGISGRMGASWRIAAALATVIGGLASTSPGAGDLLAAVGHLVDASPERPWAVPGLARALDITPRTLQQRFRQVAGCGPATWILRRRLEHARLLLQRGTTVQETAIRLGFANPFHFSRAFRRIYGIPPSFLRRSLTSDDQTR